MAQTIQIRRGTGSAVPSSLAAGELAINTDTGKFYYGNGSAVSSDFRVDSITAENYIVSSSVTSITTQTLSGSTAFGDSSDDTHQFTGDMRVTGLISASNNVFGANLNLHGTNAAITFGANDDKIYLGTNAINIAPDDTDILTVSDQGTNVQVDGDLKVTSDITASANISGSSTSNITIGGTITAQSSSVNFAKVQSAAGNEAVNFSILDDQGDVMFRSSGQGGNVSIKTEIGDVSEAGNAIRLIVDDAQERIDIHGHVDIHDNTEATDASGDTGALRVEGGASIAKRAYIGTQLSVGSHITASGNISASGLNHTFGGNVTIIKSGSDGDAVLTLFADTGNDNEAANPFIHLKQDTGGIAGQIGLTGDDNQWPSGHTLTGAKGNSMVIGMTGSQSTNNRQLYLAAGNTASLEIKNNADVHIMNGDLHLDNANALFGGTHLLIKYDGEVKIGAGNRGLELNSTTTEVNGLTTFTSAITASGNISASGIITAQGLVISDDANIADNLTFSSNVSASGMIIGGPNALTLGDPDGNVGGVTLNVLQSLNQITLNTQANGIIDITGYKINFADPVGDGIARVKILGSLTASSDISSSGTVTANTLRLLSTTDASVSSTGHAFQAGLTNSTNVIIDNNEVMARNNGAVSNLHFNPDGGIITFNNSTDDKVLIGSGHITASGNISSSGTVTANSFIETSRTRIKILSRDFVADDVGRPMQIEDDNLQSGDEAFLHSFGSANAYAIVDIPTGYTATHAKISGSDTGQNYKVYEGNIGSKDMTSKSAGTSINTEVDITDVAATDSNYLFIQVTSDGSDDEIFGGYVTITPS